MKQYLWLLNSLLVFIFIFSLLLNSILKQETPTMKKRVIAIEKIEKKKTIAISLERIYQHDLFDTYIPKEKQIIKEDLLKPIPEMINPVIKPAPEPKKQGFIPPLNLKLDGIISSDQEENNVAMIADETNKELIYHLSDKIKDGQIIRINRNHVVILRANGQQEIFLLRVEKEEPVKWENIIKKVDENHYQLDPQKFTKQIGSVGQMIEDLFLGVSYQKNIPLGIKVGKLKKDDIGTKIGLKENDIILSINDINLSKPKNRIKIYDKIMKMNLGDTIKINLQRKNEKETINYKLKKIKKPSELFFTQPAKEASNKLPSSQFKLSRQQAKEKHIRDFEKIHKEPKNKQVINDLRKKLLQNMRQRLRNRRVR